MSKSIAFLLLLFFGSTSFADEAAEIIGTWKLVSYNTELQDGSLNRPLFGPSPIGFMMFTADSRMMVVAEAENRKPPQKDEDRAVLLRTMFAYTGMYRTDGDKMIIKVDSSWNGVWNGTEQVRFFKRDDKRLHFSTGWQPYANLDGKIGRATLVFEKMQ